MDTKLVTNQFSRQGSWLRNLMALTLVVLIVSSCQKPTSDNEDSLGKLHDVTEDLHHRLKAGLFEPGKDPMVFRLAKQPNLYQRLKLPFYSEDAPHKMVRISWDRGTFWVRSDDHALVVVYMDKEAIFSHVQVATLTEFSADRRFIENRRHPVR
ncbi:MAG: hypothetical protein F4039_01460 [Gammaproteobacteria bacterium]|nr:hypothetical protein [Candidatus Poribacteria bacterium]MYK42742.1 hypothetical protein [Gammaproteobacteria bacterium]